MSLLMGHSLLLKTLKKGAWSSLLPNLSAPFSFHTNIKSRVEVLFLIEVVKKLEIRLSY